VNKGRLEGPGRSWVHPSALESKSQTWTMGSKEMERRIDKGLGGKKVWGGKEKKPRYSIILIIPRSSKNASKERKQDHQVRRPGGGVAKAGNRSEGEKPRNKGENVLDSPQNLKNKEAEQSKKNKIKHNTRRSLMDRDGTHTELLRRRKRGEHLRRPGASFQGHLHKRRPEQQRLEQDELG